MGVIQRQTKIKNIDPEICKEIFGGKYIQGECVINLEFDIDDNTKMIKNVKILKIDNDKNAK